MLRVEQSLRVLARLGSLIDQVQILIHLVHAHENFPGDGLVLRRDRNRVILKRRHRVNLELLGLRHSIVAHTTISHVVGQIVVVLLLRSGAHFRAMLALATHRHLVRQQIGFKDRGHGFHSRISYSWSVRGHGHVTLDRREAPSVLF